MRKPILFWLPAGLLLMLIFSCTSFPTASSDDQSLMVVLAEPGGNNSGSLQINSPDFSRRISPGSDGFAVIALAAGSYRVAGLPAVTVPAGSVFLYPGVLSPDGSFRELTPADQRIAMGRLSDYVGFESWFGRDYLNFGPYRPKQYLSGRYHALTIESEPEGASIRIDELLWGETPQTIELIAGKYLVEIEAPGHRPFRRIISLDGPLSLSPELIPRETEAPDAKERYSIMVAPIRSMDESEDAYGDIIAATMAANFTADPRLEAIRGSAGEADGDYPDFSSAEEVGADLLVAGRYHLDGQSLYLEAILYEATTRRVKFAQTYLSEAGLAVFDSIDTVSAGFAEAVSRVLPAPGEPIVEKEVFVGDELIAYERSIFREQMLQNRLDRKNLFGVKVGFGGIDDEITLENGDERGFGGGGNPPNQIRLDYQRILTRRLSLSATTLMHIQGISSDEEELDGPSFIPTVILMLGPEFAFRSIASEVYFTPVLMLGFRPPFSVTDTFTSQSSDIPLRLYTGVELDVGYRYFFYRKRGDRPIYAGLGMSFDMADIGFSLDGDWRLLGINGGLYIGGGVAL